MRAVLGQRHYDPASIEDTVEPSEPEVADEPEFAALLACAGPKTQALLEASTPTGESGAACPPKPGGKHVHARVVILRPDSSADGFEKAISPR